MKSFAYGRMPLLAVGIVLTISACGPANSKSFQESGPAPVVTGSCANGPTSLSINFFDENPRTSSGNFGLAFNSALTTGYTIPGTISGLVGNCNLEDDRFYITSDSLFSSNVVNATSPNQAFTPSRPEFQQLNSFYYASKLKVLMGGLGADLSFMGKIRLEAHCNYANNAFFSPSAKAVCLGYVDEGGGKKVWAADDADVVIHESGHSMNHTLASTNILNSSGEAGALDEAIADYWALTILNDGQLSEWFLGALGSSYIRDATQNHLYPSSMTYEVHDDSRPISEILWDLRSPTNLGKSITDRLVKISLELLPGTTRYSDFYQAFYDASGPGFANLSAPERALIVSKFTAKGIHRVDSASGLRLSTAPAPVKQVYIIDDHSISSQVGGNCNGQLDVGETALVLVNLENPNPAEMGMGVATLVAPPSGIQVPGGGQIGEFNRFAGTSDFISILPSGSSRTDSVIMASFLVKATSAGIKNLTLTFTPMHADPTGAQPPNLDVSVNFSLTVGSAATSGACASPSLWP